MKPLHFAWSTVALLGLASMTIADGDQKVASIGDLPLSGGGTLHDCRVGYRTFGTMSADGSNVVLIPTWFLGTSGDWADMIVKGHLIDPRRYFIVVADALGNGVSSSPSNSEMQGGTDFPAISTHDMVESQYRLLTKVLGIRHLRAAVGISMGGMQTFEWVADYPGFVDRAVPIVGTPRPSSADLTLWRGFLYVVQSAVAHPDQRRERMAELGYLFGIVLTTTHRIDANVTREQAVQQVESAAKSMANLNPMNVAVQIRAMMDHDVFEPYGGQKGLMARLRSRMLVVPSLQDRCVDPAPALAWAKAYRTQLFVLKGDGGHNAPGAEIKELSVRVNRFLDRR